ncbi:MAG: hypothetical protein V1799_12450 [bacterium]
MIQPANQTQIMGQQVQISQKIERKKVLIFSPDPMLAQSLQMLLEDRYEVECETKLEKLSARIHEANPQLLLIDLYSFSSDILRQVTVLKESLSVVPMVILRGYSQAKPDVELAIEKLSKYVFYKPINVELIRQVVENVLVNPSSGGERL